MEFINVRYLKFLQNLFKRYTKNDDHEAIITVFAEQLRKVEEDADKVKKELMLETASDDWLEDWGAWFGLSRIPNETDDHFRQRILKCMDGKVSIPAIIEGIKQIVGEDVNITIYEPFRDVRIFNVSTFSDKGRYEDDKFYRIGVIQITVDCKVTKELEKFINSLTSVGIKVYIEGTEK